VGRKVLVIDDEPDIREIVEMLLSDAGWSVLLAASGGEGVALAAREQPDAILLDVMMPVLDGPATLARLQAGPATARIPVIFLTAKAQQKDLERLRSLGAAGVLLKPFDPMQLPAQIAGLLAQA